MSLIVEDGNGLANAESYVSTAELTAYATKWGLSGFPTESTKLEVLARKATRAMDAMYSYIGDKADEDQALQWPRVGDSAPSGVPGCVKDGTCEMAYVYLTTDPLAPLSSTAAGVTEVTEQVGPLKTTTKWSDGGYTSDALLSTRKVNFIVQPVLDHLPGSMSVSVERG